MIADCIEVRSRLWEYLDGELDPAAAEAVRGHLIICRHCYVAYRVDGAFLERITRVAVVMPRAPAPLVERVRARCLDA